MTSTEGSGAASKRPLGTPEEIRRAFMERPAGGGVADLTVQRTRPLPQATPVNGTLEIVLAVTGLGLSVFMVMHMGLLATVLFGASTMDTLASFLERYYLLQSGAPILIIGIVLHVVSAVRRVPASMRQQAVLMASTRAMRHVDTFTWVVQLVSALVIAALVSIHLWVLLTDLPIEAAKSGTRIHGIYLWLYIPLLIAVESHLSAGVYRIAVKWGINRRKLLHGLLTVWTVLVLTLGAAILVAFYNLHSLGGNG